MPITLSVIVASACGREVLDDCLRALLPQCTAADIEVIVVRADDAQTVDALAHQHLGLRAIAIPIGSTLPQLRGRGLSFAQGEVALLTEDNCVVDANWVETMRQAATRSVDVVGGSLDNGLRERAADWGAFFAEYGPYSGMSAAGNASRPASFAAANVAYSRRVLADVAEWMSGGTWENVVHDRLRAQGAVLVFEPRARVTQVVRHSFLAFLANRYQHGHDYARGRVAESPSLRRWLRVAVAPLLPPLLTYRVGRTTVGSAARALAFVRALPFTFAYFCAWAVGEAAGYLDAPTPGRSR